MLLIEGTMLALWVRLWCDLRLIAAAAIVDSEFDGECDIEVVFKMEAGVLRQFPAFGV